MRSKDPTATMTSSPTKQTLQPPEAVLDVEAASRRLRSRARALIGVDPDSASTTRVSGWFLAIALGCLAGAAQVLGYAMLRLGRDIAATFGVEPGRVGTGSGLRLLTVAVFGLVIALLVDRAPQRRKRVIVGGGLLWSVAVLLAGLSHGAGDVSSAQLVAALGLGVTVLLPPLLLDAYPAGARFRALSVMYACQYAGLALAAGAQAWAQSQLGWTWRAELLLLGLLSLLLCLPAVVMPHRIAPDVDETALRSMVHADAGEADGQPGERPRLRLMEAQRRLAMIPSVRGIVAVQAVLGLMVFPLYSYLFDFLRDGWDRSATEGGALFASLNGVVAVTLLVLARSGERAFRKDPQLLVRHGVTLLVVGSLALAAAVYAPWYAAMVGLLAVALGALGAVAPVLILCLLSVVPARLRPFALAFQAMAFVLIGGLGGLLFLGGMIDRFGDFGALLTLALPGLVAAYRLYRLETRLDHDLDRTLDDVIEDAELQVLARSGAHVPMLACRRIDFSYGQLQVLFDVNFTVDDGEMVALLGTNGAGKSTLLRVISGLGIPSRGAVRYRGTDITTLDAERRLPLGIAQVPGGRAVFRHLTVHENLRLAGYSLGKDRRKVEAGIEETFSYFPRLGERRDQLASTLSGGEQQMLGLSKAFIVKPRLLLIDELSLGLAPQVVSALLDMVRRLNDQGTAIVLVEQSVNIALSLVDHAYFMEKGEIRFDGRAQDLIERADLLRSVFLKGAGSGLAEHEAVGTPVGGAR